MITAPLGRSLQLRWLLLLLLQLGAAVLSSRAPRSTAPPPPLLVLWFSQLLLPAPYFPRMQRRPHALP